MLNVYIIWVMMQSKMGAPGRGHRTTLERVKALSPHLKLSHQICEHQDVKLPSWIKQNEPPLTSILQNTHHQHLWNEWLARCDSIVLLWFSIILQVNSWWSNIMQNLCLILKLSAYLLLTCHHVNCSFEIMGSSEMIFSSV